MKTTIKPKTSTKKKLEKILSLRDSQKRVFDTLWFDEDIRYTFHLAKRQSGKTIAAIRTAVMLPVCQVGWIPSASRKIESLFSLYKTDRNGKRQIADPFKVAYFTGAAGQARGHVDSSIRLFLESFPQTIQDNIKWSEKKSAWIFTGPTGITAELVVKGIKRHIDDVRGDGYGVIFLDEAQKFPWEDIATVLLPMLRRNRTHGWFHCFATASANDSSKELWETIYNHSKGKCFKTTAKDLLILDPDDYNMDDYWEDAESAGGEESTIFRAEHMCDFSIPSISSLLGGWKPEETEYDPFQDGKYIIGIDKGTNPYTVSHFYIHNNNLLFSHINRYYREQVNIEEIIRKNVDYNCQAVILPHDSNQVEAATGQTHWQSWADQLDESVQMIYIPQSISVGDRIRGTNKHLSKVHIYKDTNKRDLDYVTSARYAIAPNAATVARYNSQIRKDRFAHDYDSFSYGVIGFFQKFKDKPRTEINVEPLVADDLEALITGDKTKGYDYAVGKYMKQVEKEENILE